MIKSVGIDFAGTGEHMVRCLNEEAQLCDSFSFPTTPDGLTKLEERIFRDGSNPVIVFEPTGLSWLPIAVYLRARHPNCRLVRAQSQKVVALRKYLHRYSKSDRIDALTLAKMPFVDDERLMEVYLPQAKAYTMQRLSRQRQRLESDIATRKTRIISILDGYLPGIRPTLSDLWSPQAKSFLRTHLNPWTTVNSGEKSLHRFLTRAAVRNKEDVQKSHALYLACQNVATIYELSRATGTIDDDFFSILQEEIDRELKLMEADEVESESIANRLEKWYQEMHPSDNLRTIPGVGEHTAPIFLAFIGDPARFRSQSAFASYNGVVPAARQSADVEAKGLKMSKAGPAMMRWALYQAGQIGRRYDPQLAWLYYREIVHNGKNHRQAMGAVMSHLGARVLAVTKEGKPYELRDIENKPITPEEARKLILSQYVVPEEIKRARRRRKNSGESALQRKGREVPAARVNEAAEAPQPVAV